MTRTAAALEHDRVMRTAWVKARWAETQQWLYALKLESGCVDCGYAEHPAALDFDHRDPTQKLFKISGALIRNREVLEAEVAKCDVVCANCHRIRTARQREDVALRGGRPRHRRQATNLLDEVAAS